MPKPAKFIWVLFLILALIGVINIFSSSFVMAGQKYNDSYLYLKAHLLSLAIGFLIMKWISKLNYHRLFRIEMILSFDIAVIILLAAVLAFGVEANGAKRWLKVGVTFQPSELAKIAAIISSAFYLGQQAYRKKAITLISWPLITTGIMAALVMKQPDMGTALLIVGLSLILYIIAGIPRKQLYILLSGSILGICYFATSESYRASRISAWLDPWAHQQDTGYQIVQSLLAIGSGRVWGSGIGKGISKFYYLPEPHTDFAFAVWCQETGFIGAFFVVILFTLFTVYGFKIAGAAKDKFGCFLAVGIVLLITGQAFGNMAMVTGIIPVTGVPLPFISFGGTSLVLNMACLGLLLSIAKSKPLKKLRLVKK